MATVKKATVERLMKKGGRAAIKARMLNAGAIETWQFCSRFDGYNCRGLYAPAMAIAGIRAGLSPAIAWKIANHYSLKYEADSLSPYGDVF